MSYQLRDHARMFGSRRRNDAYEAAIRRVVFPGSVVLDVGTGTGLLAMLACRAGASRVYAAEPEPIISLARALALRNGLADRITFLEVPSTAIELPERVDVVVSDIRGVLPLAGSSLASLIDARDRLMRPGGTMLPARDVIRGAIVSADRPYAETIEIWASAPGDLDAAPAREAATQQLMPLDAGDVVPITDPADWITIDYQAQSSPSLSGSLAWTCAGGTAHGFALWFEAQLAEGIGYASGPGSGDDLYGVAFFPWPAPIELAGGGTATVALRADFVGGAYVWTWRTAIQAGGRAFSFDQSTFQGGPIARARLPYSPRPS
jgi:protein arginine N-methyltransferase 1